MLKKTFRFQCFALGLVLVSSILGTGRMAYSATGQLIKNNTPPFVRTAHKIGPADPSQTIEITVWLNVHSRQQLDSVAEDLYDPSSPHYRAWLKFSQIAADYAPTAQEAKMVTEFLSAHKLSIVLADPDNFFVRARGTVAQVSAAFRVQMSNFKVNGKVIRANTTDPYIDGAAAPFVHLVSGLSNQQSEIVPIQRSTPSGSASSSQSPAAESGSFFTSDCFHGPTKDVLTTSGGLPAAIIPAPATCMTAQTSAAADTLHRKSKPLTTSPRCTKKGLMGRAKPSSFSRFAIRLRSSQMPTRSRRGSACQLSRQRTSASSDTLFPPPATTRPWRRVSMWNGRMPSRQALTSLSWSRLM